MRCGSVSWVSGLVCVYAVMLGAMGQPVDKNEDMVTAIPETGDLSSEMIHSTLAPEIDTTSMAPLKSQPLSVGEQEFVLRRKQAVLKSLNKLGVQCELDSVPHIALLGSGGGQKAVGGFLGSLYQLEKEGLLDTLLYLGGVSASAWVMSTLYKDPQWSTNMDKAVVRRTDPVSGLKETLSWMGEEAKEKHSSLIDIWGDLTSSGLMKQLDFMHLAEDGMNASNPYPLYSAVNKDCLQYGPENAKWFEITPHEAGFTDLGFSVETSHLRRMHEEDPEDKDSVGVFIPDWLKDKLDLFPFGKKDKEQNKLVNWRLKVLAPLQRPDQGPVTSKVSWLIEKAFTLIDNLEWGTVKNFLYRYSEDEVPSCIRRKKQLQLMDGGVVLNMPFPAFLGEKRDVDLLIALEYGSQETFKTLTRARDYAAGLKKPFPEIDDQILEEKDWPKDLYIFEGKDQEPTIIYMPLFNRKNCKDSEQFQARMKMFSTYQLSLHEEKLLFLMETAKTNIKNNKITLLQEIKKAALRRQKKKRVD